MKLQNTSEIIEVPLCNRNNPCYQNATDELTVSDTLWNRYCSDCQQQCIIIDYKVTPSSASAPDRLMSLLSQAFVNRTGVPLPENWSTNWGAEVQHNYLGLDVTCETKLVENYTQHPSMRPVDVLSNVGGQTGLWIGISFLSLMEVVEMLCRLLRYEFRLILARLRNRN